jgi:hypothetical protein
MVSWPLFSWTISFIDAFASPLLPSLSLPGQKRVTSNQVLGARYYESKVETSAAALKLETFAAALELEMDVAPLELETNIASVKLEMEMDMSKEILKQECYSAD